MLTVFQCITMEGWTDVLYWVSPVAPPSQFNILGLSHAFSLNVYSDQTHGHYLADILTMRLLIISWGSSYHSDMIDWRNDWTHSTANNNNTMLSGTYKLSLYALLKTKPSNFCSALLFKSIFPFFPALFSLLSFLCGNACSPRWMTPWALSFHGYTLSVLWSSARFSCLIWFWVCWAGKHLPLFTDREPLACCQAGGSLFLHVCLSVNWLLLAPIGERCHRMGDTLDLFC